MSRGRFGRLWAIRSDSRRGLCRRRSTARSAPYPECCVKVPGCWSSLIRIGRSLLVDGLGEGRAVAGLGLCGPLEQRSAGAGGVTGGAEGGESLAAVVVVEFGVGGPGVEPEPGSPGCCGSATGEVEQRCAEPSAGFVSGDDHPVYVQRVVLVAAVVPQLGVGGGVDGDRGDR